MTRVARLLVDVAAGGCWGAELLSGDCWGGVGEMGAVEIGDACIGSAAFDITAQKKMRERKRR